MVNKVCRFLCNSVLLCTVLVQTSSACQGGTLMQSGITQKDITDVLETHNRLRQKVAMGQVNGQPGAQNMMEMKWDEQLAAKAQEWANQCIFEHDEDRYLDRFIMGQNLGLMWSTAPLDNEIGDFKTRINSWFKEVSLYSFGGPYTSKNGHYSQLIWGESNLVGCGFSYYFANNRYNKLWVCNYGPGGNIVGVQPYMTGNPSCSNHGLATSPRWPGLCDDGNGFSIPAPQPTYENVIPDTGYSFGQYTDSLNKYNQYEVAKAIEYTVTTPKPQPPPQPQPQQAIIRTQPVRPAYQGNKLTDYTFSGFGFNRQPQQQQQQQEQQKQVVAVTAAPRPRYQFATTPKPAIVQQQQQPQIQQRIQETKPRQEVKQHSAFYTYNWDSLFKNYYSYQTGRK